ncbi:collagen-binding domain-containing protein [Streptosporangium sp. DT93]|uniref:collagen-binding domain-containing protein n=1 Tax=Streptosporangium sp. DT93 TaxID=3393428 RepID=UPI003CF62EFE
MSVLVIGLGALIAGSASVHAPLNPVSGNNGFTVVVEGDTRLNSNENEGTLAVGGDLILTGDYRVAGQTAGTFVVAGDARPTALVVGGRIDFAQSSPTGRLSVLSNAYVKIGDLTDTFVVDVDGNGALVNTRINATGDYDAPARVELTVRQPAASVGPVSVIDFAALFATYRQRAADLALCANTVILRDGNGVPLPGNVVPPGSNVRINLTDGITNVLQIDAANLNNIANLIFDDLPTATAPLLVVVDTTAVGGDFTWAPPNFAGVSGREGQYILFDFPDATTIRLPAGAGDTIEGTIFAPDAALIDENSSNIEGNVIVRELTAGTATANGGEIHHFPFGTQLDCAALPPTPTPTPTITPTPTPTPTITPTPTPTVTPTVTPTPTPVVTVTVTVTPTPTPVVCPSSGVHTSTHQSSSSVVKCASRCQEGRGRCRGAHRCHARRGCSGPVWPEEKAAIPRRP